MSNEVILVVLFHPACCKICSTWFLRLQLPLISVRFPLSMRHDGTGPAK
ncbi:hypothetical protein BDA96_03G063800 [Sorghum bicolor]|uniref:Uncharacterized protein n=1 Tax=Sorghum bicolor TaxID=4558 RepID=A0A921ULZ0_SORBI|nr:hypothetical protein BDA96_03G063800 [Sorghum bicolor]